MPSSPKELKDLTPGQAYARRAEILRLWHLYQRPDQPLVHAAAAGDFKSKPIETFVGFLGKRKDIGKHLSFANLTTPAGEVLQLCANAEHSSVAHSRFRNIPAFSPVRVRAVEEDEEKEDEEQQQEQEPKETFNSSDKQPCQSRAANKGDQTKRRRSLLLNDIRPLNSVPENWFVPTDSRFPPSDRHLQIRFHPELQARLKFRSWLKGEFTKYMMDERFVEVETPTLFKSTPEGAREFLVPTRHRGMAYALSQSPQQYKQVLMASGIPRYMQWARCYRDEDARSDRQPEFTQASMPRPSPCSLDLEWAFTSAAEVMNQVTDMIVHVLKAFCPAQSYEVINGAKIPVVPDLRRKASFASPTHCFTNITFADSIAAFGTDQPDLRIPNRIHAFRDLDSIRQFVGVISRLSDPLVEAFTLRPQSRSIKDIRRFVRKFMDDLPQAFDKNPDGKPQILIWDESQPLRGFSSLGHGYQRILESTLGQADFRGGDIFVFQARKKPMTGHVPSSTMLGKFRKLLWNSLVEEGFLNKQRLGQPGSLQFTWVTEFPMFKPVERGEPGQGVAGLACSHHPFTAPLSEGDLELLFTKPLEAKSATYDLVLNGIEIGGGSQRNHIAVVQEFIMRDILRMPEEKVQGFSHLLNALRSGCPPHAGFALGFDRFVALLCDTGTVRDVIAFPKTMKGEDPFVESPGKLSDEQLAPYGLQLAATERHGEPDG
ncbi:hypothetical protein L249_0648 [Ophiocordyceps polyrhachis-furcata BCC 54312]|uniref:Aminoacyl-transfer RNA synthetases class-II family profile domain-containing protein n=1 Tax=Ophiocordyceps polyrhachis-furcata BCC 54312 TaxID=1330021 RepID=A0A367LDW1_9HYPO|nr:hypothetical protein L249_0648 [Ophiocordyceps polyrhachis-furcata BCC 54312]